MITYSGIVYFASDTAKRSRYMKEGEHVTIDTYHAAHAIEPGFVSIDFDSTGTNYIHLSIEKER